MPAHMHAVIKIVSFLVFGAAMALGNPQNLLAGALLVLPLYLTDRGHWGHAWRILSRLRWLFVSILVVYLFFTPGQLLVADWPWGPTLQGLQLGLLRVAVLVLLVLAVNWLLASTAQEELVSAIVWCLRPLGVLGFPHERLAVRIALTLETVHALRDSYRQQPRAIDKEGIASRFRTITQTAMRLFHTVLQEAETQPLREITLVTQSAPPRLQWVIPLLMAGGFYLLAHYQNEFRQLLGAG